MNYDNLFHPYQRPCPVCGSITNTANGKPAMCEDCRRERDSENSRRRYARLRSSRDAKVKILHDPLPFYQGGFRPGASITKLEMICGIENRTFLLGTVFQINDKREILKRINGKYKLVMEARNENH